MTPQAIQIKLEQMKSNSYEYADQTHLVASYKVNVTDKQFELKTNLKTFKRHFTEAEGFFSRFALIPGEKKPEEKKEPIEPLTPSTETSVAVVATQEPNIGIADELVRILKDNITKVKADAKFIPQAQQISNSVNQIINIERLRLDMMKHAGFKPKMNGNGNHQD